MLALKASWNSAGFDLLRTFIFTPFFFTFVTFHTFISFRSISKSYLMVVGRVKLNILTSSGVTDNVASHVKHVSV
jgi:hypothetical protein